MSSESNSTNIEYEYSTKSLHNKCAALNRFLNCRTSIDPIVYARFDDMCRRMFSELFFDETLVDFTKDLLDHGDSAGYTGAKRDKYFTNIN